LELEKLQEIQPCTFEVESGLQVIDLGVFFTLAHIKDMTNFVSHKINENEETAGDST
jgi:hypothetical protein